MSEAANEATETPPHTLRRAVRLLARAGSALCWIVVIAGALLVLVPGLTGLDRYVITGNSMAPEFHRGAIVFSEPVPVEDLEVGDIITYRPPPETNVTQNVTHRITSIDTTDDGQRLFETKGDANQTADPWKFVLSASHQNVVVHHVPVLGHLLAFLSNPSNRMLVIGVPAGVIAVRALLDLLGLPRSRFVDDEDDEEIEEADRAPKSGDDEDRRHDGGGQLRTELGGPTPGVDLTDDAVDPHRVHELVR